MLIAAKRVNTARSPSALSPAGYRYPYLISRLRECSSSPTKRSCRRGERRNGRIITFQYEVERAVHVRKFKAVYVSL